MPSAMPSAPVRPWGAPGHTRTAGLIVVAVVHVAMVAALVEGFRRHAAPKPPPLTQVQVDIARTPPPPVSPVDPPPMPRMIEPAPRFVDVPDIPVTPPTVAPVVATETVTPTVPGPISTSGDGGQAQGTGTTGGTAGPVTRDPVAPGLVCTSMGAPVMPAVQWNGEAVFRAVAEVQGGRVVAVDIRTLQGGMDARTRRAFTASIETALRQHYVCPGHHRFQQDFGFRVD